jgi:hypothetical protein
VWVRLVGRMLSSMNPIHINARRTIRMLTLAALLTGAALVPAAANAAQPKAGAYAGKTTQSAPTAYTGSVKLNVVKADGYYKLTKVTGRVKLDCQGDPARIKKFSVAVPLESGNVSESGRFSYSKFTTATAGFTIKGRFLTRSKASGKLFLGETSGCYVPGGAKWAASLR